MWWEIGIYLFMGMIVDGIVIYAIAKHNLQNRPGVGFLILITPIVWPAVGMAMLLSFLDDNKKGKDVNRKNAD